MPVTRNSVWPGKNHPALGGSSGVGESWGAGPSRRASALLRMSGGVADAAGAAAIAADGGELLGQITRFMQRQGLSDGDYGRLIKDLKFLERLRGGSWPKASNIARQRAIMAAYDRKSRL